MSVVLFGFFFILVPLNIIDELFTSAPFLARRKASTHRFREKWRTPLLFRKIPKSATVCPARMALPLEISRTNQNARCRASPESSSARGLFAIRLARPPRAETGINTHTTVFKMAAISCISGVALPARISARRSGKHPVALPGTARNRPASVSRFSTLSAREKPARRRATGRSFRRPRLAREARTRVARSPPGSRSRESRVRVVERACRVSSRPTRAVSERAPPAATPERGESSIDRTRSRSTLTTSPLRLTSTGIQGKAVRMPRAVRGSVSVRAMKTVA